MDNSYDIKIIDGKGYLEVDNGIYNVSSNVKGYVDSNIRPSIIEITDDKNYDFTVFSDGHISFFVSEDGVVGSKVIVGAKFVRCDQNGVTYGDEVVSNEIGEAYLLNLPYDIESSDVVIYYKQTSSDGKHLFDDSLHSIVMNEFAKVIMITNPLDDNRK